MGIGYIIGDKSNKADFITGKETIPVEALTENGIDEKQIHECLIQRFERPRKQKRKFRRAAYFDKSDNRQPRNSNCLIRKIPDFSIQA